MDPWVQKNLKEIIEYTGKDIHDLLDNGIDYIEAGNDTELGQWLIDEGGYTIAPELEDYIDYEAFGRDARINDGGAYVDGRYIW